MSPDEGLSDGERIKLWVWATLSQTPEAKLVLKLDGRLTMAEALLAHRASGEGGSTSALRASAPEGMKAALERIGNYDVYFEDKADAVRHLNAMIRIAREAVYGEVDRGPTQVVSIDDNGNPVLVDHLPPQAVKQANLARAAHSLAPEGIDALADGCTGVLRDALLGGNPLRLIEAVAFELRCVAKYHQRATKAEVRVRGEFLVKLSDLLHHAKKRSHAQSVGAAPPPTPEGIDATHTPLERQQQLAITYLGGLLQRHRVGAGWSLRGSHQDVEAAWKLANEAMAAYHAVPIAVREPAQSDGANAPALPEGA